MAQLILSSVGQTVGGPIGQVIGSTIGRAIDQRAIAGLAPPRQKGPRLETLKVQGTAEGAPMACVFGRARIVGQVIWAARFRETRRTSSGGKGGPRTVEYGYSLSFALALCEGEIDGIGRVWADGRPMDLAGVTMRVHRGGSDQTPDPLIEAVEGTAPAYRGTAYVVFEDLPLGPYGNRPPQLGFEVFRRPRGNRARLEDLLEGVCLIPGAGEFVLATDAVRRREGLTRTRPENLHAGDGRTDLVVSLDQLQAQCPNLKRVSLVIGWFGDDLRAGHCAIRPGVERRDKATEPLTWSVAGLGRAEAHLISDSGGGPAYGGTPSDASVRQAVATLKARGLEVTLYPFVLMDVPVGNGLPDPYGGGEQAAYPWRGRLTAGDGPEAPSEVEAIFGEADGWGLRRLALHYAALAAETGADGLLIGSEMRGLTRVRDAAGEFPAVGEFRSLAAECRSVVGPEVALSYAADWSEYAGLRDGDDVRFHLDPLWADPAIDYVGIDWYPPMGDWRGGEGGMDHLAFAGPDDPDYLAAQVAGGEGFDWFYASLPDREAQDRSPIIDTAHGEDWVFRVKDLKGWWSNAHRDRPDGIRSATPTAWVPGMKPVRLTEFGCPAVDRGANAPNLFQDPKSAESALPPHSTGTRDDRVQRRTLEAVLGHFGDVANNPVSALYGGPMVTAADAWCWDARPWPAFPARSDVWADAGGWRTGHWLNGRLTGDTRDLIAEILKRGGLDESAFEVGDFAGEVQGYVIDRPMRTRDALEPLLAGLGLIAAERDGQVAVIGDEEPVCALMRESLALAEEGADLEVERVLEPIPGAARVRYIDADTDYQTGTTVVRSVGEGGGVDLDLPAVCSGALARAAAGRALETGAVNRLKLKPGPVEALVLEAGDTVTVEGRAGRWRLLRLDMDEAPSATLEPVPAPTPGADIGYPMPGDPNGVFGAPFFRILDLPPLIIDEEEAGPVPVVAADPWRPMAIFGGPDPESLTIRAEVTRPWTVGALLEPLSAGCRHRWDEVGAILVRVEGQAPESRSKRTVFSGGNSMVVETAEGWELVQFRTATLVGDDTWRLTGLLRGQQGTEAVGAVPGAVVAFLDHVPDRAELARAERGLPLVWRAGPVGGPAGGAETGEIVLSVTGVHGRPWSPAHLRAFARADGGIDLRWIERARLDGDRWDGVGPASGSPRFRVRVLDGTEVVRVLEVEATTVTYAASDLALDFPGGPGPGARVAVAQWGDGYGWGVEARRPLI